MKEKNIAGNRKILIPEYWEEGNKRKSETIVLKRLNKIKKVKI